jgi:hypothetical protein
MIQNSLTKSIKMKTIIKAKKLNGQKKIEEDIKSKNSSNLYLKKDNNSSILKHLNDSKCEQTDKKKCRICFENKSQNLPLISPCLCEGSIKYVHQNCLKKWLIKSNIKPELAKCEICKCKYEIRFYKDNKFDKNGFQKFIFYLLCFFIGMILVLGFLILCFYFYIFDDNEKKKNQKKKFLIISISTSLLLIILICIIIFFTYYKKCSIKPFENYEILNRNINEGILSSFTMAMSKNMMRFNPNKIQFNNFFSTGILNFSNDINNNNN